MAKEAKKMRSFLDMERKNLNNAIRLTASAFLEAKKNNKARCGCGNTENFKIIADKNILLCKICNMEIKLNEKAVHV